MSLYAIKNDEGKYWDEVDETWTTTPCDSWESKESADEVASEHHSRVVELVDAPAKVVVTQEEAEMLNNALWPATAIANFSAGKQVNTDMNALEYRLMRAYVNGWVVEKPKRWNVKVPHVDDQYYCKMPDGLSTWADGSSNADQSQQFTLAEIERYGLGDCEKVRVE